MSSSQNSDILPAGPSCQRCGLTTKAPELLIPDEKKRLYCMPCRLALIRNRAIKSALIWMGVLVMVNLIFSPGSFGQATLPVILIIFSSYAMGSVCTIMHELGHALAARAMGWEIHALALGFGRMLGKFRVGRTLVSIRSSIFGGFCVATPKQFTDRFLREAAVMILAGPLTNLIVAGIGIFILLQMYPVTNWAFYAWLVFTFMNLILGVSNLTPTMFNGLGIRMGSDGMQLKWIRTEPEKYRERFEYGQSMTYFMMARQFDEHQNAKDVLLAMRHRYPDDPTIMLNLAATELELGNYEASLNLSEELLQRQDRGDTLTSPMHEMSPMLSPNFYRAGAFDNMASALLALNRNLPEALECARYSYEIIPWMPEVQATLGHALWKNGSPEEGIPMMEKALKKLGDHPDSFILRWKNLIAEAKSNPSRPGGPLNEL